MTDDNKKKITLRGENGGQSEERLSNFFNKSINYNTRQSHHRLPPKPKAKTLAAETNSG